MATNCVKFDKRTRCLRHYTLVFPQCHPQKRLVREVTFWDSVLAQQNYKNHRKLINTKHGIQCCLLKILLNEIRHKR